MTSYNDYKAGAKNWVDRSMTEHLFVSFLVVGTLSLRSVVDGGADLLYPSVCDCARFDQIQDSHAQLSAERKLAGEQKGFFEEGEALWDHFFVAAALSASGLICARHCRVGRVKGQLEVDALQDLSLHLHDFLSKSVSLFDPCWKLFERNVVLLQKFAGYPQGSCCPHSHFPAAGLDFTRSCSLVLIEHGYSEKKGLSADKSIFGFDGIEGLELGCSGIALMALWVMLNDRVGLGH